MEKILTFFTFIIYLFSFVSHNSVMAFSHDQDLSNHNLSISGLSLEHSHEKDHHKKQAECSLIVNFDQNIHFNSDNLLKKDTIKINYDFEYISFIPNFKINTNYLKINSPPYLQNDIKNYNYSQLIKIIKSNT